MMMDNKEVAEIIRAVLAGKSAAFSRLLEEFGLPLRAYIHARVQNVADAEDLAQETFIAAYRGLSKFQTDQSFEAWLYGIARHRVFGYYRSTTRRQRSNERFREECLVRIEPELQEVEQDNELGSLTKLVACIESLPERMRIVIRSRLQGHDGSMIADLIKTTRGAVYMLQLRANEQLRECMMKGTQ
jgi:RNA polymerase sigma-70 factor (ECF subfamily)